MDFEKGELRVLRSKTGVPRIIPLHPALVEVLGNLPDGRLFRKNSLRDGLAFACKSVGVKVTPYQFRHSFATHVLNATKDLRAVQQLLGHSSIQMTTRYATALEDRLKEAVESI